MTVVDALPIMSDGMLRRVLLCFFIFFSFGAISARAGEVDSFTDRERIPADSSRLVNLVTIGLIESVLDRLNKDPELTKSQCDPDLLRQALAAVLDTNLSEVTEVFSSKVAGIFLMQHQYGRKEFTKILSGTGKSGHSAFENLVRRIGTESGLWRGVPLDTEENIFYEHRRDEMYSVLASSFLCCSPIVNIKGHQAGLDKIGHFFENSYELYRMKKKKGLKEALDYSNGQEEQTWGLWFTGVYSYGDMAANYDGIRFWEWLLDGTETEPAAIQCEEGVYSFHGDFRIEDYVTDAWDEAINCSTFSEKVAKTAMPKILTRTNGMGCPVDLDACTKLVDRYPPEVAARVLHPRCLHARKLIEQRTLAQAPSCGEGGFSDFISNEGSFFGALGVAFQHWLLKDAERSK